MKRGTYVVFKDRACSPITTERNVYSVSSPLLMGLDVHSGTASITNTTRRYAGHAWPCVDA